MILPAKPSDHISLSHLTFISKAHWGYEPAQMEKWREELTINPTYIEENIVFKWQTDQAISAYYSMIRKGNDQIELDNLFVHPDELGKGYGTKLLMHALSWSHQNHYAEMFLTADPHATNYYLRFGFKIIQQLPSSIPGRFLPLMSIKIGADLNQLRKKS